jgi:hypothetical protein
MVLGRAIPQRLCLVRFRQAGPSPDFDIGIGILLSLLHALDDKTPLFLCKFDTHAKVSPRIIGRGLKCNRTACHW